MLCLALSDTDTSFYHEIGKESLSLFELISRERSYLPVLSASLRMAAGKARKMLPIVKRRKSFLLFYIPISIIPLYRHLSVATIP